MELLSKNSNICRNLRYSSEDGALKPVVGAANVEIPEDYTPVGVYENKVFANSGNILAVIRHGQAVNPVNLAFTPAKILDLKGRFLALGSSGEKQLIEYDNDSDKLIADSYAPHYSPTDVNPDISFESAGPITEQINPVSLSASFAASGVLTPGDLKAIQSATADATRRLNAHAWRLGRIIHPLMAKVRLYDVEGRLTYESEPQLFRMAAEEAVPAYVQIKENTDGSHTTFPLSITTAAYNLRLTMPPTAVPAVALGTVQVLCSPVVPIVDLEGKPSVAPRQRADQNFLATVRFAPGSAALNDDSAELNTVRFLQLASNQGCWTEVYSARVGFGRLDCVIPVPRLREAQEADFRACASVATVYPSLAHQFTSQGCAVAQQVALWGAPKTHRAAAPALSSLVHSRTEAQALWHGYVAVKMADGALMVSEESGATGCPLKLRPCISYPAPDAVEVTIAWWNASGGHFAVTVPLTADASGMRSVYIHPSGMPFAPSRVNEPFAVPEGVETLISRPAGLVATPVREPGRPIAQAELPEGRVIALLPAAGAAASWDYGRARFLVFSSAGVYSVNVDPDRGSMSTVLIDRRCLAKPNDAVAIPRGVVAVLDGDVVLFAGNSIKVLASAVGNVQPVWCAENGGEIWLVGLPDTVVIPYESPQSKYSFDQKLGRSEHSSWLHSTQGWHLAAHNAPAAMVHVTWEGAVAAPQVAAGTPCRLTLEAVGSASELNISLTRTTLTRRAPAPDYRLIVNGPLYSPLSAAFLAPPARSFTALISGNVSVNTLIKSLALVGA